jgi:Protein of unknown function (DUF3108)
MTGERKLPMAFLGIGFQYRRRLVSLVALGSVLLDRSARPVMADDYISPDLVKVSTPHYQPWTARFEPRLGVYRYTVSWEGIPAASATLTVDEVGQNFKIVAAARTYSGIDLLYRLRYTAEGVIEGFSLSPVRLTIDHQENSRTKNIKVEFSPSGEIHSTRMQRVGQPVEEIRFHSLNTTLDPIGAAFLARSLEWEVGDVRSFDVFNGKSRYLISLEAIGREVIEHGGVNRPTIVISPQVRNLTTKEPVQKLRQARMYISEDENRDMLRLVSSVFIGSVTTELDSFEPFADAAGGVRMAQMRRPVGGSTRPTLQ